MLNEKYQARIVKSPTFFREIIEVGALKLQGYSKKELKRKLIEENPLKITPERRNQEISSAVLVRVETLTESELLVLQNGSLSEKKYITMIAVMKSERIVRELINEVYVDKLEIGQMIIDDGDLNVFFRKKSEEQDAVAKWQDVTVRKMKQVMKKMLKELEFIRVDGKNMEIQAPLVSKEFLDAIDHEDDSIKRVFKRGY